MPPHVYLSKIYIYCHIHCPSYVIQHIHIYHSKKQQRKFTTNIIETVYPSYESFQIPAVSGEGHISRHNKDSGMGLPKNSNRMHILFSHCSRSAQISYIKHIFSPITNNYTYSNLFSNLISNQSQMITRTATFSHHLNNLCNAIYITYIFTYWGYFRFTITRLIPSYSPIFKSIC